VDWTAWRNSSGWVELAMSDPSDSETVQDQRIMSEQCRQALELALADQERGWRVGQPIMVEGFLEREPALRRNTEAILDLIYKEVLARTAQGEKPDQDEYTRRFPNLEGALRPLFEVHQALEGQPEQVSTVSQDQQTFSSQVQEVPGKAPELPGYELLERLGHGGMGVVYKARQKSLGRTVALKMVLAGAHASPEELARFRREAEAVAKLAHPNIVQIHEIGEHAGLPFLSLELVAGGALDKRLGGAPQPARDAASLIETLARAVHHAHLQNVVHRDLKPANILMTDSGIAKITDFGLARLGAGSGQTQSGDILGTPSYMAPEQAAGRSSAIGPATDVYALGATLYELLTGRPPFRAESPLHTLRLVMDQEPVSPSRLQPGIPHDLVIICLKSLEKAPSRRYSSAEDLADDLRRFLDGRPILARETPAWERLLKWSRRRPALAALAAVSAAAVLLIVLYNLWLQSALSDATHQRGAAQKALEERRRQLVQVLLADGARRLEEGDWFGSLLPLAEAARLDENDSQRAAIHAIRLNTILRQCPRLVQFWPHQGEVQHAEFSPDGQSVLTAAGKRVTLWDLGPGKKVLHLNHETDIRSVAMSSDGRQVATAAADRRVHVWEATTGRPLGQLSSQDNEILRLAFVAKENHIVVVTRREENKIRIQVWDIARGKSVSPALEVGTGILFEVVLSPDGRQALTAGKTLEVWDVIQGRRAFEMPGSPLLTQARFSSDCRLVAAADVTGAVRIWDARSGQALVSVRHAPPIRDVAFSPDGRYLITGGVDGMARVWRLFGGQLAGEMRHGQAFTHAVIQVSFSPDGRHNVLVAGADNTVRVWAETVPASPLLRHSDRVTRASFSPDGRFVLTACADGTVRVWDLAAGRLAIPPLEGDERVTHVAFGADGRRVVTACEDGLARIWDAASAQPQGSLVHPFPVRYAAFAEKGRVVTTAEDNSRGEGEACVWDAAIRKPVFRRRTAQKVQGVAPGDLGIRRAWFSADGHFVLLLNQSGVSQVWDTATGQPVTGLLEHKSSVNAASFSFDGLRLLTNTFVPEYSARLWETSGNRLDELYRRLRPDNTATIWELPSGKRAVSIGEPGGATAFRHASFSRDGDRLILLRDGATEIRQAATGQLVRSFRKPGTTVGRAALSPKGRILVTASEDRTAQLWDAASGETIVTAPQFQHGGQGWQPLFSPDGRLLVMSSPVGVRVWEGATGDPISPPLIHPADVDCVSFSPDGRLLLTASDHAARVWPIDAHRKTADDFLRLAQLLCCARMRADGGRLVPLSLAELIRAWEELWREFPGEFATPSHDADTWFTEAARACERNQQWAAALFQLDRLAAREPARPDIYDRKGRAHAELVQWKEAAAAFARATQLGADRPGPWYRHAILRLHLNDRPGYRLACADMLKRFNPEDDVAAAQLTARACVLAATSEDDGSQIIALAQRNVAGRPNDRSCHWTLGAALYRARRWNDAMRVLNESLKLDGKEDTILLHLFLAMIHHHMGERDQAGKYMQQAITLTRQAMKDTASGAPGGPRLTWSERLELVIVGSEAQALLKERRAQPPTPAGLGKRENRGRPGSDQDGRR
jgi:WD40 repeat protein/tRNA A-37 threonylcarbamoyl transferase component Bud32